MARILNISAMIVLSIFSISATAFGFSLYMSEETTATIVSFAIQILLIGSVHLVCQNGTKLRSLYAMGICFIALGFSVSGSFLRFHNWLSLSEREADLRIREIHEVATVKLTALEALEHRGSYLDVEIAGLRSALDAEERSGVYSSGYSGKGVHYHSMFSTLVQLREARGFILQTTQSLNRCSRFDEDCLVKALRLVPSDQFLRKRLFLASSFLDVKERVKVPILWPSYPEPDEMIKKGAFSVTNAWKALLRGRNNSFLSFLAAVALDLLVIFCVLSDQLQTRK